MNTFRKLTLSPLLLAALLLSACGSAREGPIAPEVAPRVGYPAPDFQLRTPEGEFYKLSDLRGQAVLLNFWVTTCHFCRYEMPTIQAIYTKYRDQGLVILGISKGDSASDVVDFARQQQLTFPLLLDHKGRVAEAYRVTAFPHSYFIDREGVIRSTQIGEMLKAEMAVQVEAALAEVPPE